MPDGPGPPKRAGAGPYQGTDLPMVVSEERKNAVLK